MNNKILSKQLSLLSKLGDLHGENAFKTKAYAGAAFSIGRLSENLFELPEEDLRKISGIGKGIADKITELKTQGFISELETLVSKTPAGIFELFRIKGLGPKKISILWKTAGIDSMAALMQACQENKLAEIKGFGKKTQEDLLHNLQFAEAAADKFHYVSVHEQAEEVLQQLRKKFPNLPISLSGEIRRKCPVVSGIEILVGSEQILPEIEKWQSDIPLNIHTCPPEKFVSTLFKQSAHPEHLRMLTNIPDHAADEASIYAAHALPYIIPEMREGKDEFNWAKKYAGETIIEYQHLQGILHNHTTFSDGIHTLEEMAVACRAKGFSYLGICDHSQTAVYAGGLKPLDIVHQHEDIDALNLVMAPFRIFKGIESDILPDGSLDYPDEILLTFDFIVASVHSGLKMTEEKATQRLIRAIENPFTTILGHPTGRLLLMREGYPIDHRKIIDACAANGVIIELNANPYRMDMDWEWLYYAMEKNVFISINPDAHSVEGYADMQLGVHSARKGGLLKRFTFNALSVQEVEEYFSRRK